MSGIFYDNEVKPLPKLKSPTPDRGKKKKKMLPETKSLGEPTPPNMISGYHYKANVTSKPEEGKNTISLNTSDFIFTQVTAISSCPMDGYLIKAENSKYVNANGNAWSNKDLLKYYQTFIGGHNYYGHEQCSRQSYGFIIDARIRPVGPVFYVDLLVATSLKYTPNVNILNKIISNEINTLSMGCASSSCLCSRCGEYNYDVENTNLCSHLQYSMGQIFTDKYGRQYTTCMIASDKSKDPQDSGFIEFYEISWVKDPAFSGAISSYRLNPPPSTEIFFEIPSSALEREGLDYNGLKYWVDMNQVKIKR